MPCGDARRNSGVLHVNVTSEERVRSRCASSRRARCSSAPLAQVKPTRRLDPVAVTASRTPQPIADLLADVTVIGRDEIVRSGAQSLAEAPAAPAGVEITMNGGPGIDVRRVPARRQPRPDARADRRPSRGVVVGRAQPSLEAIPLDQIERIEILRGPASSLYGADAIGGVIQVFTKRAERRAFVPNARRATARTTRATSTRDCAARSGRCVLGARRATRAPASTPIVNPANFSSTPIATAIKKRLGQRGAAVGRRAGAHGRSTSAIAQQSVRRRPGLRRPHDHDARRPGRSPAATSSRRSVSLLSRGDGSDDTCPQTAFGDFPFKTTQRQYLWQNEVTLPLGMLTAGLERREEHLTTSESFAVT